MAQIIPLDQPGMVDPVARPEPKRDRWDRYLIPDPATGQERAWTRATTWAKSVADTFSLSQWSERQVALGLSQRPDILAGVAALASLDPDQEDNKKKLQKLCDQAKEAAQASARATLGTALHGLAEAHDLGREMKHIPQPFDQDLAAYEKVMRGVQISRNYIEKIVVVHKLGVAGTMDRLVRFHHRPLPLIGDIKTGENLNYSWTEIVIQLALYAHANTIYDPLSQMHHEMPEVDQKEALVIHLLPGRARGDLYLVDIEAGWEMALTCGSVRRWRNRKDLHRLLASSDQERKT